MTTITLPKILQKDQDKLLLTRVEIVIVHQKEEFTTTQAALQQVCEKARFYDSKHMTLEQDSYQLTLEFWFDLDGLVIDFLTDMQRLEKIILAAVNREIVDVEYTA